MLYVTLLYYNCDDIIIIIITLGLYNMMGVRDVHEDEPKSRSGPRLYRSNMPNTRLEKRRGEKFAPTARNNRVTFTTLSSLYHR